MWYSILLKSSGAVQYSSFIPSSILFFFSFFFFSFFYFSYSRVLFYLFVSCRGTLSFFSFFFFLFFIFLLIFYLPQELTFASQRNLSGKRKWQAFMAKEKKHKFGLHVRCCSQPSSLTIHEEHLMQALAFLHA